MPKVISRINTVSVKYELNDLEMAIMEILNKYPTTVPHIRTILQFHGMDEITSMEISRTLSDLCVLGLARKERKNARGYIYSIQEQH